MNNNKICGYSCEHNKGGVCQITMCDKTLQLSTITQNCYQVMDRYYTEGYVKKLQKEIERLNNIINELEEYLLNHYEVGNEIQNEWNDDILDKLKELKKVEE